METKCSASVRTFEGLSRFTLQESVQLLYRTHEEASLPVMVSIMSHVPEYFYSLKEQIIGAVVEECKDGPSRPCSKPPLETNACNLYQKSLFRPETRETEWRVLPWQFTALLPPHRLLTPGMEEECFSGRIEDAARIHGGFGWVTVRSRFLGKRVYVGFRFMNHPAPANSRYKPTCYEHAANCYTHAFLIVPAIVGSALLHRLSDDRWEKITAWMYGMGLCALFIVSTVFHIVSWKKSHLRTMEHCFHMCDRMMIYVFIAASYAPWLNLRELGPLASHMRWFIWLMAAGGTIYVFLYHEKYKIVELFFYLAMGFSPALVVTSMSNTDGLQEVAWGGLIYCLGVVFFKSDGVIPFAHAIWHIFVATAAAVHYYAIWKYLYRSPADIIRHL
ncbi:PREDICTED: monocyte to macrophage differentiation factor [Pygoscelis adeliae]|nr:PREDICTED: monocyte to macrophage differentiation factor [Pygoscelis adeliae]